MSGKMGLYCPMERILFHYSLEHLKEQKGDSNLWYSCDEHEICIGVLAPYNGVVQPSPIRPGLPLEDFIQQSIGSFIVVEDSTKIPSPSATITTSIEALDDSS
eukprot:Gb_18348 [translate_table: standard]